TPRSCRCRRPRARPTCCPPADWRQSAAGALRNLGPGGYTVKLTPVTGFSDAPVALFPAHPERNAVRGADRLAPPDAARRPDPAGGRGNLRLAAAGSAGAEEDRANRARGAEPRRGDRNPDADHPAGRPV